jgi:hypothetical protein
MSGLITRLQDSERGVGSNSLVMCREEGLAIHKLCVTVVEELREWPFHVKHGRWIARLPLVYPQGVQAIYVVFHVKRGCLWITSVDNVSRGASPTQGDVRAPRHVTESAKRSSSRTGGIDSGQCRLAGLGSRRARQHHPPARLHPLAILPI